MDITDEMLQAAVRKAIEAGLLPRNACRENANENKEMMRLIVQAALSAEPQNAFRTNSPAYSRSPIRATFPGTPDMKRASPVYAYSSH